MVQDSSEDSPSVVKEASTMRIYLAGTIDNHALNECLSWRVDMMDLLAPYGIETIDPTQTILPTPDSTPNRQSFTVPSRAIVERDLLDLRSCNLMVVCFPKNSKKHSIGSLMEMVYARQENIPVLLIDFSGRYAGHPWVEEHTTMRYETVADCVAGILNYWRV